MSSCAACSKFPRGTITALALDHRQSLRKANHTFQNDQELSRFKVDLTNLLAKRSTAVLLDPEVSAAQVIAQQAIPPKHRLGAPHCALRSSILISP